MRILVEDIAAVKRNYPKISDADFDRIIRLDPTFVEGRDSVGQYGKWLLNLFNKGKLDNEGHIPDLLTRFEENKKYLKNKDIGQFKSIEDVDAYLNDDDNYKDKSHRQEVRDRQKGRKNADLTKDAKVVYKDSDWTVWVPETYEASCKLGQGSSWCTASTESDHYYKWYTSDGSALYIIINNSNPEEKYQFHIESGSFMNKDDKTINVVDFLNKNEGLNKLFRPMMLKQLGLSDEDIEKGEVSTSFSLNASEYEFREWFGDEWGKFIREMLGGWGDGYQYFESSTEYFPGIKEITYLKFPDYVKEALQEAGVTDIEKAYEESDDFRWAIEVAYRTGEESGSYSEAYNDIIKAIEDVGGKISDEKIIFVHTIDEILRYWSENNIDTDCDMYEFTSNCVRENFSLTEPYYGWHEFDEEAFFEDLVYRLDEVGPIELDTEDSVDEGYDDLEDSFNLNEFLEKHGIR